MIWFCVVLILVSLIFLNKHIINLISRMNKMETKIRELENEIKNLNERIDDTGIDL